MNQPKPVSPFQQVWADRASRYGLSVAIPFTMSLDAQPITFPVLLRAFGATNGMVLVTDYALIRPYAAQLVELGYGFSCLSEPEDPFEEDEEGLFGMLRDWGWSGNGSAPAWLRERIG